MARAGRVSSRRGSQSGSVARVCGCLVVIVMTLNEMKHWRFFGQAVT